MKDDSGQNQDFRGPATERDADEGESLIDQLVAATIRDLQLIIHAGLNLNGTHCRKLQALPYLQCLLEAFSSEAIRESRIAVFPEGQPPIPEPTRVRSAIRKAIQELRALSQSQNAIPLTHPPVEPLDDPEEAEQCFETRMRLFGFTPATQTKGPVARRRAALNYYNEHLNKRPKSVEPDNFRKNVIPSLCLPIIDILWMREGELREQREDTLAGLSLSTETIGQLWTNVYWWLYRVGMLLLDAASSADWFIRTRDDMQLTRPFIQPPVSESSEQSDQAEISTDRHLKVALYKVAIIWRFIEYEDWPPGWSDQPSLVAESPSLGIFSLPKMTMSDALTSFQEAFAFTESDSDWIDLTLNRIFRDLKPLSPQAPSTAFANVVARGGNDPSTAAFVSAVDTDIHGQVVYGRFAALTNACRCYIEPTVNACIFHVLLSQAISLNEEIDAGWLALAKSEVSLRDFHSVPIWDDID